jgi:hypothetical protein
MKILFTLVTIDCGNEMYLHAVKNLINELITLTPHNVILSTNNIVFFDDLESDRLIKRNNIEEGVVYKFGSEFNYNLKYHAFLDLPPNYDVIIYLDCDIKLKQWDENSEKIVKMFESEYDFGATRLNCILGDQVKYYLENQSCLFRHKIESYKILDNYSIDDEIMNSKLPSEHFLVFKNDQSKISKFANKWRELNNYMQSINGMGGCWGDGFEIGISTNFAGFTKQIDLNSDGHLGFIFNGNKY